MAGIARYFRTTAERLAYVPTTEEIGFLYRDLEDGEMYFARARVAGTGGWISLSDAAGGPFLPLTGATMTGAIRQTPVQFAFGASVSLDVSAGNAFQMTDIVTSDWALTLTGGASGDCGTIAFKQAAAGGKKITGVTVSGRTVLMRDDLTTLNTTAALVANAHCVLYYEFGTDVNAVVQLGIKAGVAAAYT
jgi:hypothetical protein